MAVFDVAAKLDPTEKRPIIGQDNLSGRHAANRWKAFRNAENLAFSVSLADFYIFFILRTSFACLLSQPFTRYRHWGRHSERSSNLPFAWQAR
jgi:hypothetical protein